eukprot:TRINITY_DN4386_c0_g1_i3.p1 TRINITY_DN4386_c0_g1~~TRINITY_DN4386_c0_g1_i3.p1  ORF type:complete len:412 (+),score=132.88 TRINITY_DN4386_c0_g1_i3:90-1238(+)
MAAMDLVRGVFILSTMLFTAFIGALVLLPPALPLLLLPGRQLFHWWTCFVKELWFLNVCLLLETVAGIKYHVWTPDGAPIPAESAFIMCNHRTRIDWMMAWPLLARLPGGHLRQLRIALKAELKSLPGFGWSMQHFRFLFIERKGKLEDTLSRMAAQTRYYRHFKEAVTLFIFPEGTDLSPSTLARSNAFAKEKGLPETRHVLQPKATGSRVLLNGLRGAVTAVWDVTVAYKDRRPGERPSEVRLAQGRFPKAVHFNIARYGIDEVPAEEEPFKKWVANRFAEKESALAPFYPEDPSQEPACGFAGCRELRNCGTPWGSYAAAAAFWAVLSVCWIWSVQSSRLAVLYYLAVSVFYVVIGACFGGVDKAIIGFGTHNFGKKDE